MESQKNISFRLYIFVEFEVDVHEIGEKNNSWSANDIFGYFSLFRKPAKPNQFKQMLWWKIE